MRQSRTPGDDISSGKKRTLEIAQMARGCAMLVLKRLMADESGAAAVEYGLMATGMALALMDVIENVAVTVKATFMLFGQSPA